MQRELFGFRHGFFSILLKWVQSFNQSLLPDSLWWHNNKRQSAVFSLFSTCEKKTQNASVVTFGRILPLWIIFNYVLGQFTYWPVWLELRDWECVLQEPLSPDSSQSAGGCDKALMAASDQAVWVTDGLWHDERPQHFPPQVHGSCLDKPPSLLVLLPASPGVLMCCLRANIIHTCGVVDAERWASLCVWQKSDSPRLVPGNLVLAHILQSRQEFSLQDIGITKRPLPTTIIIISVIMNPIIWACKTRKLEQTLLVSLVWKMLLHMPIISMHSLNPSWINAATIWFPANLLPTATARCFHVLWAWKVQRLQLECS